MHVKEVGFIIRTASIPCKGVHAGLSTEDMGLGTDNSEAGLRTEEAIAPFLAAVPLFAQFKTYRPARTEAFDYFFYRPQRSWGKVMFLHVSVILSTISGDRRNTYGWQAGGMHPTEMLSCFVNIYQWRIQDFPEGGAPTPKVGVLTYYFAHYFLPKTA